MSTYIDGFVHPIPRDRFEDYRHLVAAVAEIWKEHGALDYQEFIGDDLHLEGTRSFTDLVDTGDDEIVIFGWVTFDSKEARDAANKKVAADSRVEKLMANTDAGFDARRMAYAGFRPIAE